MIEIKDLRYTYENSKETVIRDLTLTVQDGEFVCVLGHSGCGKSTLIHLLAGLLPLQSGSITRDGRNMNVPGMDRAVVFQQYSLFPWQTVRGNVLFAMKKSCRFGKEEMERRADLFLRKTGMENAQDKYPYQLSGGMRQRTAIARALASGAEVLLLDEPFGALDPAIRADLQKLLRKLWREEKKTVIFVTHDLDEALAMGTRIVFMRNGAIGREMEISERISECCAGSKGYSDCRELRASLEEWFHES
ncbi:MAG: ABC transporter ATP-binding protein [Eubacteriales bacterium]|nr:ABC transporter ATP-binding protein [Eubacteriales bacterium]